MLVFSDSHQDPGSDVVDVLDVLGGTHHPSSFNVININTQL